MNNLGLKLAAAGVLGTSLWVGSANAVDISIKLSETGFADQIFGPVAGENNISNQSIGTFNRISVDGLGTPPGVPPDILSTTSTDVSSSSSGTLTISVTSQHITDPTGLLNFLSSFTSNRLPAGWSVSMATFLDAGDGLFAMTTALSSASFSAIGTASLAQAANTGGGPYSVTEVITLSATGAGTALSTIDLAVPGPIVGAGLPGLLAAFGGLVALARRRRRAAAI